MEDKFNLTPEQNLFLAKKVLVTNVYNGAKLEGINVTYPETQTILDGVNVTTLKLDEINTVLNLRDAWKFMLSNIDEEFNLEYLCKINSFVSRNESLEWGVLRNGKVGISGTDYIPEIPTREEAEAKLDEILKEQNITKRAIKLMLKGMRYQLFWDGNKRTSLIAANKIMISNGKGIITIKEEFLNEFNKLLTEYYTTNEIAKIEKFIYDNCIFGLEMN